MTQELIYEVYSALALINDEHERGEMVCSMLLCERCFKVGDDDAICDVCEDMCARFETAVNNASWMHCNCEIS